ncbi:hypothetical protein ACFE04_030373 [Oxalis oulophora]
MRKYSFSFTFIAIESADLLQKLSLDAQAKKFDLPEPNKKTSVYQYGSVDSHNGPNGQIPSFDRSLTPFRPEYLDPSMCYPHNLYPYYYGGYDATANEWSSYSRMMNPDGFDLTSGLFNPGQLSGMGTGRGYNNRMYPNKMYGSQYGSTFRSGMGFGSGVYDSRSYGRGGWSNFDSKFKNRGRGFGYGNENVDGLNELNKGPRSNTLRNAKPLKDEDVKSIGTADVAVADEKLSAVVVPDMEQYNKEDFATDMADAKFFIIKSYSEDDVHKSIKYNVWTSTANGNKKLDAAYQEAQQKSPACPIFLFFSVNTSGQFVGLAEMTGPVDFQKSVEYWQQDNKWAGSFSVKWHIVKDIPNNSLRHITLEYNESKPVTNSRDTQEVKLEDGLKMVTIFKEYSSKTNLLDDFAFYESRHKSLQEKKAKQQQFQKQIWEGKATDEKLANGALKPTDLTKDVKIPENGVVANGVNSIAVSEKPLANGVANGGSDMLVANGAC